MRALLLALGVWAGAGAVQAGSAVQPFCAQAPSLSAAQQDRVLSFAALVRQELEGSGQAVALVSRAGLKLQRFNLRYSHAGVSLKASANGAWSVRQLYYACDEQRPRLYDQGLAGFVLGNDDANSGYVSIVLLPGAQAAALEGTALTAPTALRLLGTSYSANAHAFSQAHQNCNQWLVELIAAAWGALGPGENLRAQAQAWLQDQGYAPKPVDVGSHWLMLAAPFIPWVHLDDHPQDDLYALRFRTSTPAAIEAFVHQHLPGAQRIELCHDGRQAVIHHGWEPLGEGCVAGPNDRVVALQ